MHSLVAYIARGLIAPVVTKGWLSKPHVRLRRYLGLYQEAFEAGAVLGYTYRGDMECFAQLFSDNGHQGDLITVIQELARERLSDVPDATSFVELAMFAEEERIRAQFSYADTTLTEQQLDQLEDKQKMPLETAFQNIQVAVSTGIGFGSAYPELTEQFWRVEHEKIITQDEVDKWRKAGLDIPPTIEPPVTLAQRGKQLRSQVEAFAAETYPEFLERFKVANG